MPSGAKKRRAAKKKKENQSNNNPTPSSVSTQTHGDGDYAKHQDDKDSDVGEISSPASQDHHNNFSGGEEEIGDKIEVIDEPRIVVDESFVPVEREFKIENESDKKDGKFEHDEIASKLYDGGSSRSSNNNSSSDDETLEIKQRQAENISLSGEKAEMDMSSQANNTIEDSELEENREKKAISFEDEVGISEAFEDASLHPEEEIIDTTKCIEKETDDRLSLSYNAPIACADHGGDHEKDSGVFQPLLAPAPHPEQKISWKSCCGLFEVFTGSGR